ncbi:MAG: glycosyltransferase family 4 protein, partial [Halobacteria archaeon]
MRIALVGRFFAPVFGGVEFHMENLGLQMVKRGHEVTVFTRDTDNRGQPLPPKETLHGLRVVRVGSAGALGRALRAWEGDLFHFHLIHKPFVALGMRAVRKDPRPKVFTPHCVYPSRNLKVRLVKAAYDPTLGRMSLRLADRIICLTENDRADVLRMGAPGERIVLIPNALAEERFEAVKTDPEGFRRKYGVERFLLYVGRIDWVKGLEFAVDAMAELKREGLSLVCVGQDFGLRAELEARAERLGVSD